MLIELLPRWPFVRRHRPPIVRPIISFPPKASGQSRHGTPHHAHRTWVSTEHGVGWIHHHEHDGYTVEFEDGRLLKCKHVKNVEAPK